jgi:hypothetical protein
MPQMAETKSMAIFCDFENVALGVRDAKYPQFDIRKILERLLLKGNIVVRRPTPTGAAIGNAGPACTRPPLS